MMKANKRQELQVHIGEALDDMGRRFVDAWANRDSGRLIEPRCNNTRDAVWSDLYNS